MQKGMESWASWYICIVAAQKTQDHDAGRALTRNRKDLSEITHRKIEQTKQPSVKRKWVADMQLFETAMPDSHMDLPSFLYEKLL